METENTDIYVIPEISDDARNAIKNMSVYALPDSPAAFGMKAGAVKPKFWKPLVEGDHSLVGLINALIEALNTTFNDVKKKQDLTVTSIDKTSSEGLVDTYTITFLSGETSTFTVSNGEKGDNYVLTDDDKTEIGHIVLALLFGDELPVARIGKEYYSSFYDALEAAQDGDIIFLLRDSTLTSNIAIAKSITIDGQGHKITASVNNVHLFTVTADLTLQNLDITYTGGINTENTKESYAVISAPTCNLSISVIDCNITSDARGIMLSGGETGGYNATLTVQGSTIIAGNMAIFTWYANPYITITNSVILGKSSYKDVYWTTVLIEGGCRQFYISNSVISGRSRGLSLWKSSGTVQIGKDSVIGNGWEGLASYGIESDGTYAIEVYGRRYTEYYVVLNANATLTSSGKDEVYFREYDGTNNIYFGPEYDGPIPTSKLPFGAAGDNVYSFHNSIVDAVANGYENILIPYGSLTVTEPIKITGVTRIDTAHFFLGFVIKPKINYVGSDALFELGLGASVSLSLNGVDVSADKILSGFDGTQTVAVGDEALANALISEGYSVSFDSGTGYYVVV